MLASTDLLGVKDNYLEPRVYDHALLSSNGDLTLEAGAWPFLHSSAQL